MIDWYESLADARDAMAQDDRTLLVYLHAPG